MLLEREQVGGISGISQLAICPPQHTLHDNACHDREQRECHHEKIGLDIPRSVARGEEVWAPDISQLTQQVDDGCCARSLLRSLIERRARPAKDHRVGRKATADVQESCGISGGIVDSGNGDDKADTGYGLWYCNVVSSVLASIAGPRGEKRRTSSNQVWRCREDECERSVTQVEALDNCWEEAIESVGAVVGSEHDHLGVVCQLP